MAFKSGAQALRKLHGVFCVYKPEGMMMGPLLVHIKDKIIRDINALPCYNQEIKKSKQKLLQDSNKRIEGGHTDTSPGLLMTENPSLPAKWQSGLSTQSALSCLDMDMQMSDEEMVENRLVLGDRYETSDFRVYANNGLWKFSSGIVVLGISYHNKTEKRLSTRYIQVYHVRGRLGWASDNFSVRGRIVERTTFRHVDKSLVEKVCAAVQTNHQKMMFEYAGVHPESQEAYELATRGLLRPEADNKEPLIYSIKCIDFESPHFTLEVHTVNEKCNFLTELIHQLGLLMKSSAVCVSIRRIRSGVYDLPYALLYEDLTLKNIVENIRKCEAIKPRTERKNISETLGSLSTTNRTVFVKPRKTKLRYSAEEKALRKHRKCEEIHDRNIQTEVGLFLKDKLNQEGKVKEI